MKILVLYFSTAVIFLAIDLVGLRLLVKPVFDRHVAHLFAVPFRMAPAAIFYFGYIAGVLFFVSLPALRANDPIAALYGGFALGLLCYGTYEFTNYATLKDWSTEQVMVDTLWGGALTALTAWIGVMFVRWIW